MAQSASRPAAPEARPPGRVPPSPRTATTALALGALGVVFGDIGTSPLYAIQQVFTGPNTLTPDQSRIYGVLSLVFWSLTIIVTVKYVAIVMRANNDGEGGIMALVSLVKRMHTHSGRVTIALILLGVFGASLFYGDGMITPAISVLSAVEGLKVATPGIGDLVIPIALVLLVALFVSQRYGTHAVGRFFGPVMLIWFSAIAALGITAIVDHPGILRALSPSYAVSFFLDDPQTAFFALASVVLVVTGAEALYADMGHFGAGAIRRAWLLVALPALLLNYFGQGAFLLGQPAATDNPFFRMSPAWAQLPLVLLATLATVIASQAVISGAFSMSRQAVQLGFLPRMTIRHTSSREIGQVYVPAVNWILFAAVVTLVLGFRSSSNLASAYGVAVTGTFVTTTVLASVVFAAHSERRLLVLLCGAAFLLIDLAFFSANLTKLLHGGWFPLAIAGTVFAILSTWRRGRQLALQRLAEGEIPLDVFLARLDTDPPMRVPGTAVYLTATDGGTPGPLRKNLAHNRVLHQQIVLFTVATRTIPRVRDEDRLTVEELGHGVHRIIAEYGFQEEPDAPAALRLAQDRGLPIDTEHASYFLNHITLNITRRPGMARWRKHLFAVISRNSIRAAAFLHLPSNRVFELGTQIDL